MRQLDLSTRDLSTPPSQRPLEELELICDHLDNLACKLEIHKNGSSGRTTSLLGMFARAEQIVDSSNSRGTGRQALERMGKMANELSALSESLDAMKIAAQILPTHIDVPDNGPSYHSVSTTIRNPSTHTRSTVCIF